MAAVLLRDSVESVAANEYAALLHELIPTVRRLLRDVPAQFQDSSEHVRPSPLPRAALWRPS
jgi:hypothetical protein